MYPAPPKYQRWLALLIIGFIWILSLNLAVATLSKIREFKGWDSFMVFSNANADKPSKVLQSRTESFVSKTLTSAINPQFTIVNTSTALPSITMFTTPQTISTTIITEPTQAALLFTAIPTPAQFLPPRCRYSGESLFNTIGQKGEITRNIRIRTSPTDGLATEIKSGTLFEIIGASRCAIPSGYSAETLFLHVRLIGLSREYIGWIPESGIGSSNRVIYNVKIIK